MRARVTSLSVSILVHAGVVAAFVVGLPLRDPPGAVDHGLQGIEVMLSAGGAAGAQAAEPPPPEPPEPEKPQVVEKPPEPPPPPPEPEPQVITSKAPETDVAEAPKPDVKPRPEPPKPKPVVQKPQPAPKPPEVVEKPVEAPPQEIKMAAAPVPVSQGQVGQRSAPGAGSGSASSSGGNPGAEADYYARLSAWLEQHKEYPWRAQRRHHEGVAYLEFVVGQDGRVLRHSIKRSSGYRLLDEAVERMIEKASPLPPIPDVLGKDRLEIIVPVEFFLK